LDELIKVCGNGERNEVKNVILKLPSSVMGKGKNKKMRRIRVGAECAPLQVANLPQRNTHTDWRRREHFSLVVIQDQSVLFAFILGDTQIQIYAGLPLRSSGK
jgi:hypothetical protein